MDTTSDPVSAEELLDHLDWVRRLARGLVRDPDAADDVVQETWLAALSRPPQSRSNLRGWLATITRNVAAQRGRSESARGRREREVSRRDELPSTASLVELASVQRALVDHVIALDEPYRTAILLHYIREMPVAEIAAREGVAVETVRSRVSRGLEKLRAKLDTTNGGRQRWLRVIAPIAATEAARSLPTLATLGAVALLLLCALGGTWLALDRSSREVDIVLVEPTSVSRGGTLVDGDPGSGEPDPGRVVVATMPTAATKAGVLALRFIDAVDGTAIPELAFVVVEEFDRSSSVRIASGASDEEGRAFLEDVPRRTLVVETVRNPPHAAVSFAFDASVAREVLVRVGHGGRVRGRVVDDLGKPRPGIVLVRGSGPRPQNPTTLRGRPERIAVLAETSDDGRFVVEHLHSSARAIRIVGDEQRAEHWEPVELGIADRRWLGVGFHRLVLQIDEGDEFDVGDVVLPRDRSIHGKVRHADGGAAGGVLVSVESRRSAMGGRADFGPQSGWKPATDAGVAPAELPGETLTRADGSFELVLTSIGMVVDRVSLWTASGHRETVTIPLPGAGERRDLGEVVLKHRAPLEFALAVAGDFARKPSRATIHRVLDDGRESSSSIDIDVDGIARDTQYERASELRAIAVWVDGFEPVRLELPGGTDEGARFEVALSARPRIRAEFAWNDATRAPRLEDVTFRVEVCLLPPEERPEGALVEGVASVQCCGLGARNSGMLARNELAIDLPVQTGRPYWVYVRGWSRSVGFDRQAFGPWDPSPTETRQLVLDSSALEPLPDPSTSEPVVIPPKTTPHEPWQRTCAVRARLVDGGDGSLVGSAHLEFAKPDAAKAGKTPNMEPTGADGATEAQIEGGRWRVSVIAQGYRTLDVATIDAVGGEAIDLGTIVLEPLAVLRARIVDARGVPAAGMHASVGESDAKIDQAGTVEIPWTGDGPMPSSFPLRVGARPVFFTRQPREQRLLVTGARPGETVELALEPWVELSIELDGIGPDLRRAQIEVTVLALDPLVAGDVSMPDERLVAAPSASFDETKPRRFRTALAPGRYRLTVVSLVVRADPVEIEIDASPEHRTVRIPVR